MESSNNIERLRELANSYVPEWNFDEENPDIGTALALVCAEMMWEVKLRYRKILYKKRIDFLNSLGGDLTTASCAEGLVTFHLVNSEVPGQLVPSGTFLTADCDKEESGLLYFETLDDILVSHAKADCLYEVSVKDDYIGGTELSPEQTVLPLFHKSFPNQQMYELYIGHSHLFDATSKVTIILGLERYGGIPLEPSLLEHLIHEDLAEISYFSEDGYISFQSKEVDSNQLILIRGEKQPIPKSQCIDNIENMWIRIRFLNREKFKRFLLNKVTCSIQLEDYPLDFVYGGGQEVDLHEYYPFGEQIHEFSEVYFCANEILKNAGAMISLKFWLRYQRIPLAANEEKKSIQWDWVMSKEEIEEQKLYDITIGKVIWEYYNGHGWARLYQDKTNENVFSAEVEQCYCNIEFLCPTDIASCEVNGIMTYAIRARITGVNHAYQLHGYYVVPVLANTTMSCDYSKHPVEDLSVVAYRNLEYQRMNASGICPVYPLECDAQCLYLGFRNKPENGPMKYYFDFVNHMDRSDANLLWEYLGETGPKNLRVIDETVNFSKSGFVTLLGADDFKKGMLFGKERYWIRIKDASHFYESEMGKELAPQLKGILYNTVRAVNRNREETRYFQMDYYEQNKKIFLQRQRIQKIKVYIKEKVIGKLEMEWKEWTRVEDFLNSGPEDEHYILFPNEGVIQFGDGASGKIPTVMEEQNIKVAYQCGGGSLGNIGPHKINRMVRTIPFISAVDNPQRFDGGQDKEDVEHAIKRCASQVRMRNRLITPKDYESLAYEVSKRVCKARCFSGLNQNGELETGAVTIVLLLKDFDSGKAQFEGVRKAIEHAMVGKVYDGLLESGKIAVIAPKFIEYRVKIVIQIENLNQIFEVKKQTEEMLENFLNPITGNFDHKGWEMGTLPKQIQIRNLVQMIPNVVAVNNIFLTVYSYQDEGRSELLLEQAIKCQYALPVSGLVEVTVE